MLAKILVTADKLVKMYGAFFHIDVIYKCLVLAKQFNLLLFNAKTYSMTNNEKFI